MKIYSTIRPNIILDVIMADSILSPEEMDVVDAYITATQARPLELYRYDEVAEDTAYAERMLCERLASRPSLAYWRADGSREYL